MLRSLIRLRYALTILLGSFVTFVLGEEITLYVDAGSKDCLHYEIEEGTGFEVQFHVLRGGNLDISFIILDPNDRVLAADMRRFTRLHRVTASTSGPFQFCLDNSFSRSSHKIVYFHIFLDAPSRDAISDNLDTIYLTKEEEYANAIKPVLEKIHFNMDKSIHYQNSFSALEARDRSIIESNFESINFWSALHLCVMVSAAVINLIVIRKLFDDESRLKA